MEICTGDHSIKEIFQHNDNWNTFRNKHSTLIRPAVIENVNKVLACKTEKLGFHQYVCPDCGESKKVPHTCKSRFCSSCGKIAVDNWVQTSVSRFPDIQYRHIVFTLPEQLRMVCIMNRKLMLSALFKLAACSIISWAKENQNCTPGIISVLHTFGKTLEFNPHIHIIVSCGGLSLDHSSWVPVFFFPEKVLKTRWKYNVLSFIRSAFKDNELALAKPLKLLTYPAFNSFLNMLYQRYIWYVHIGKKLDCLSFTVKYIGRYTKRPVLAETRISAFDGNSVSFWFDDRNLQKKISITLPVEEFIQRIIRHIPDKYFKQIRYFGIFANRVRAKLCGKVLDLLHKEWIAHCDVLSWRQRLIRQNGRDPLACPNCNILMRLAFAVYPSTLTIRGAPT